MIIKSVTKSLKKNRKASPKRTNSPKRSGASLPILDNTFIGTKAWSIRSGESHADWAVFMQYCTSGAASVSDWIEAVRTQMTSFPAGCKTEGTIHKKAAKYHWQARRNAFYNDKAEKIWQAQEAINKAEGNAIVSTMNDIMFLIKRKLKKMIDGNEDFSTQEIVQFNKMFLEYHAVINDPHSRTGEVQFDQVAQWPLQKQQSLLEQLDAIEADLVNE